MQSEDGTSPLSVATKKGNVAIAQELLAHGALIDAEAYYRAMSVTSLALSVTSVTSNFLCLNCIREQSEVAIDY